MGEADSLIFEDYCPDPGTGNTGIVQMEFEDSANAVFQANIATVYSSDGSGVWEITSFNLPSRAAEVN